MPNNKQKNISFNKGIVRTPSYSQTDGELSELVNLIPRNGELVNILPPAKMSYPIMSSNEQLVAIHHVSPGDEDILIMFVDNSGSTNPSTPSTLSWCFSTSTVGRTEICSASSATEFEITPIGNVLCLSNTETIQYFLWDSTINYNAGGYINLGDANFNIDLQFGIESTLGSNTLEDIDAVKLIKTTTISGNPDYSGLKFLTRITNSAPSGKGKEAITSQPLLATKTYYVKGDAKNWNSKLNIRIYFSTTNDWKSLSIDAPHIDLPTGEKSGTFTPPQQSSDPTVSWPYYFFLWVNRVDTKFGDWNYLWQVWDNAVYDFDYFSIYELDSTQQDNSNMGYKLDKGADTLVGMANEFVTSMTKSNYFVMPFFVRYGIRLKTGQIINLSAPCFIEPNTLYAPFFMLDERKVDGTLVSVVPTVKAFYSQLYYRRAESLPQGFDKWTIDIVDSIVIAITPPIYLYDQSVSEETMESNSVIIQSSGNEQSYDGYSWGQSDDRSRTISGELTAGGFARGTLLFPPTGGKRNSENGRYIDTAIKDRTRNALSTWYIVKEIPINALNSSEGWVKLSFDANVLSAIYAQDTGDINTLSDTAVSYYKFAGTNGTFSYNNRLFYFGGVEQRFKGWNPMRMSGWVGSWDDSSSTTTYTTVLFNDGTGVQETGWKTNGRTASASALRFLAYPDSSAKKMEVYGYGNYAYVLNPQGTSELAIHLYYESASGSASSQYSRSTSISYPNKLYMSYANQPLALDRNASLTFSGSIRALSVVTKALSQGQFGQFPLYVFTSDGIWALEVTSTGSIASSHPVSRDVITENIKPLQTDDAIFFITAQGLKKLTGSTITLVSRALEGAVLNTSNYLLPTLTIPAQDSPPVDPATLITSILNGITETLSVTTSDFISGLQQSTTKLLYDYYQQLVHVFIGNQQTHYVYDIQDGTWARQQFIQFKYTSGYYFESEVIKNPKSVVAQYPLSIIQIDRTSGNTTTTALYRYDSSMRGSSPFGSLVSGQTSFPRFAGLITRPIDFEDPSTMTTLMDARIIKQQTTAENFQRVRVFGSKDGYRWHLVKSLKRSSFKYYRFVIYSVMPDNDALQGLTAIYQPRRTHKLR